MLALLIVPTTIVRRHGGCVERRFRQRGFSVSKPVKPFGREAGELFAVGPDGRLLFAMRQSSGVYEASECRVVLNWLSEVEALMRDARR